MIPTALLVALGGGAGAAARYLVTLRVTGRRGTVLVNTVGSALLGATLAAAGDSASTVALVGVGFCGAFTTFSSVAVETDRLAAGGDRRVAVRFGVRVAVASLVAVAVGTAVGRLLVGRAL